ncbi:Glutathione S-transferase, partial [Oryctes borbonicus]
YYRTRVYRNREAPVRKIVMSALHLSTVEGKLRLYSMQYCPFAHRVRLILRAKNVDHDIVNINLINKPEWYTNVHPEGKVPALDTGSKVIVESLNICDFLDKEYPNPPLYPAEPLAVEQDKDLIQKIEPLTSIFSKIILGKETKSPSEWKDELLPHLEIFNNELKKRDTKYFGGDNPRMIVFLRQIKLVFRCHLPDGLIHLLRHKRTHHTKSLFLFPGHSELKLGFALLIIYLN